MKIHKGDTVIIKLGKDRGKTGKVVGVITKNDTLLVDGLNLYKRHQKARSKDQKGGIIEKPMPIKRSNVMIFDPKTKKGVRVGYISEEGKKTRVMKVSGKNIKI